MTIEEQIAARYTPHRYDEFGSPIWEGRGWLVRGWAGMVTVFAQADADVNESLAACARTAIYGAVLKAGSSPSSSVTVRVIASGRKDSGSLLAFLRPAILSEIELFHAQETVSPQLIPWPEKGKRCMEAAFKVRLRS